jgi:hypothetical protein
MTMKTWLYLSFFALSTGLSWAGTPEELANQSFLFLKDGEYEKLAALYETRSIQSFRETLSFIHDLPEEIAMEVLGGLFVVKTPAELQPMTDTQFMAAFVGGIMGQAKELGEVNMEMKIVGTVTENPSLSHVISRVSIVMGGISAESMDVLSMKKTEDGYRILVDPEMMNTAEQFRVMFVEND